MLVGSVVGPAIVATLTLLALVPRIDELFLDSRLIGAIVYYNGGAAFLVVPLWAAVYLAGSQRTYPILRDLV